ncbi:MFS transporter [Steroidobacter flavus]|uniref:MFS transporter n=1 Tax=Steroidobacter flavus TaxID=1842136 RepID=A0ABV8T3Z9_9GAMM
MVAESSITELTANASARRAWVITVFMTVCFTLSYMDRHVLSLLVEPIKQSLALSDTQIGLAQGLSFSIFYVLASLPLARLSDRGHRPRIMSACIAMWCSMTALCGFVTNFWQLLLARIGVASSEAGLPPAALTMLADMNDAKGLARANSVFMLAPYLGGGLALMGGGAVYAWVQTLDLQMEPWRWVFLIIGAPGLLAAALMLLVPEPRRERSAASSKSSFKGLAQFLRADAGFYACYVLAISMLVMMLNAIVSWMPAVLMRSFHLEPKAAGAVFGPTFLIAGIAGTLIAGQVISKAGDSHARSTVERIFRYMRLSVWIALPAAAIAPLAPSVSLQIAVIAVAIFCVSSVNSLSSMPFLLLVPTHIRAQAVAFLALVTALVGTGLGPMLVGMLSDALAFTKHPLPFALACVGITAATIAAFLLQWLVKRARQMTAPQFL